METQYIVKIKGAVKIPDYIEIRDKDFILVGYFRADRPEKGLEKLGLGDDIEKIKEIIDQLEFGKLQELKIP